MSAVRGLQLEVKFGDMPARSAIVTVDGVECRVNFGNSVVNAGTGCSHADRDCFKVKSVTPLRKLEPTALEALVASRSQLAHSWQVVKARPGVVFQPGHLQGGH